MPAMRSGLLAVAAVALVAVAGCTHGPKHRPGGSSQTGHAGGTAVVGSRLHWHSCGHASGPLRCASLQVPLNYAKPSGRKITLALAEVPATAPPSRRQGILVVNPGGPGGSMWLPGGVNLAKIGRA